MSHVLLPLIDCPNLQLALNQITDKGENPNEPRPELQFLVSPQNTNRVLETTVNPSAGKLKTVDVIYTPRVTTEEVDTTLDKSCTTGVNAGASSTQYTIDENVGAQYGEDIEISDLTRICQGNPEYFAKRVLAILDGVKRKMQISVADQIALLNGKFASDNGEQNLSVGNTLKTVSTKFPVATDGGKWNPEALQEIMFSAKNSGFTGIPYVFGFGNIWRYWNYLTALGNFSDGGMDFATYVNQNQAAFLPSMSMHKALNGSGSGNKFMVVDTGSLFLLQYNRFADPLAKQKGDMLIMDTIIDPTTGIEFNYKVSKPCDETITVIVSTAFKVVGLPDDIYSGGDRLEGTNGVLEFAITNS